MVGEACGDDVAATKTVLLEVEHSALCPAVSIGQSGSKGVHNPPGRPQILMSDGQEIAGRHIVVAAGTFGPAGNTYPPPDLLDANIDPHPSLQMMSCSSSKAQGFAS